MKPSAGRLSHRLGSRALAAARSSAPVAQMGTPLPFATWYACQARLLDIKLLILELIVVNWTHLPKVIFRTHCLPVAGSPRSAFQVAFAPAAHTYATRADARLASFPCGASYPRQLLHVASSGALMDPWVRVRTGDYVNAAVVVTQLLAILVAVLLPRVYVRVRHWLLFAVNAVALVGTAASVAWTPAALLPVGAASHLGHYWGSVMVLYLAWKSIYVLRVPSSYQLPFGLVLWLMTMAVMPAVRASLYPPPYGPAADTPSDILQGASPLTAPQLTHQPPHHKRLVSLLQQLLQWPAIWTAVLSFLVMVVIPYAVARAWEQAALRPRYRAYVTKAAAAGGTNRSGFRTQQPAGGSDAVGVQDVKDAVWSDSPPAGGAQPPRVASMGSGGSLPGEEEAGPSTGPTSAAGAGVGSDGPCCSNCYSAHNAAKTLDGETSVLPMPVTTGISSAPSVSDGGGTRRVSSSAAGAATAPAAPACTAPSINSPTKATCSTSSPTYQGSEPQAHQQQHQQQEHDLERQEPSRQADGGSATSHDHPATLPSLLHSLHPRRPWLDIGLLMPTAASHGTAHVDSGRQKLRNSECGCGSGSGSGDVNTSIANCKGYRSSTCSPLYGNLSPCKIKMLSVKVPLRHELGSGAPPDSSFAADATRVVDAANATIARHNAAAAAAAAAGSATGASAGAAGQAPDVAASCMEGTPPRAVSLSCVCVKGCVHLLLLVREHAGGGYGPDVDQLQQHAGMDTGGAGGAVVRHTTIGVGDSWNNVNGSEAQGGLQMELDAAVEAAVLAMLSQGTGDSSADGGVGGGWGDGGAAALAVVWPPAVAVRDPNSGGAPGDVVEAGHAAAAAGPGGWRGAADSGAEVFVVCGVSLLRGLEAVRCVVAGQGSGTGAGEAAGEAEQAQGQGSVYVDTVLPMASHEDEHGQQQGPVEAADAGGVAGVRVARFRLPLPRSALRSPGVLTLHLLPPPSVCAQPEHPAPAPPSQSHSHAPLCFLPLLVLPAAAAREVAQLHAYAAAREMGWGEEEGQEGAEEPLQGAAVGEGSAAHTARVSRLLAGTCSGGANEAAATMAALHSNGMYSLSYDVGALLDLPDTTARGVAPDPRVFCGVLQLLAERGMGACLRVGLGAMQRAGVRLVDYGGSGRMDISGWIDEGVDSTFRDACVGAPRGWMDPVMADTSSSRSSYCGAAVHAGAESAPAGIVRQHAWDSSCSSWGGDSRGVELEQHRAAHASCAGVQGPADLRTPSGGLRRLRLLSPFANAANPAGASLAPTTSRRRPSLSPSTSSLPLPLPPPHGTWRWWLRSLLFGFSPAPLEKTYQDSFKAARCRACDCGALALNVAMPTVTLVRMLRDGGQQGGTAAGVCGLQDGCPSGHVAARGGGYDPQLAAQVLWLSCAVASLLLASLTHLHARHRNAALVVRGLATAAALALITWTAPVTSGPAAGAAGGAPSATQPWLLVPDGWVINCQCYGLHWFVFSLWEPAMLQLSLPLQAVVSTAYLVPAALLQLRVHPLTAVGQSQGHRQGMAVAGGWAGVSFASSTPTAAAWRSAAVFAVGNAVCGLVISAVTDMAGRVAFVGELRRRAAVAGRQQQQQQVHSSTSCRDGVADSSTCVRHGVKE